MHPGAEAPGEGSKMVPKKSGGKVMENWWKVMKKWCKMWKSDGKVMKSQEMSVIWQANDCHWTNGVYKYCILQDLNPRKFYVGVSFRNFIACPSKIQQVQQIGPHFAFESNVAAESKNWTEHSYFQWCHSTTFPDLRFLMFLAVTLFGGFLRVKLVVLGCDSFGNVGRAKKKRSKSDLPQTICQTHGGHSGFRIVLVEDFGQISPRFAGKTANS